VGDNSFRFIKTCTSYSIYQCVAKRVFPYLFSAKSKSMVNKRLCNENILMYVPVDLNIIIAAV
jgi:hypothetical protein